MTTRTDRGGRNVGQAGARAPLGRGKALLFRIVAVVGIPLLLLAGMEAGLRIAGFGESTRFLVPVSG